MRELKPILDGDVTDALVLVPANPEPADSAHVEDATATSAERFTLPLSDELRGFLTEHFGFVVEKDETADSVGEVGADGDSSAPAVVAGNNSEAGAESGAPSNSQAEEKPEGEADDKPKPAAAPTKPSFEEPRVLLSPREIQNRIRGGETVEELVEFSGMQPRKIEAFAYPVMAERARIAELGKQSRPRRQDGPTKLSLWEILATAFAARGLNLEDSAWDAYRDPTGQWIVTVTWSVGHTTNVAEWSYQAEGMSALTVARNGLAAELVDPEFSRRHRDLTPQVAEEADTPTAPAQSPASDTRSPSAQSSMPSAWQMPRGEGASSVEDDDDIDDDFLQHPEAEHHPKRKKKTVMPSWEDVLLGVRPHGPKK
nr:septation protein SepH [Corynebacterium lactis]